MARKTKSLDLHGYEVDEALVAFTSFCNRWVRQGCYGPLEIIHGWGSSGYGGHILSRVRSYISEHRDYFGLVVEGDCWDNPGVTTVYLKRELPQPDMLSRLGSNNTRPQRPKGNYGNDQSSHGASPDRGSVLHEELLRVCREPKSQEKIESKLHTFFLLRDIRKALTELQHNGKLRAVRCGSKVVYERIESQRDST